MEAELTRHFGKRPPFFNQRPPIVQHNIQRPETGNVDHTFNHNSFSDSETVKKNKTMKAVYVLVV